MASLPVDIYSVASVRQIDRAAIDNGGISGYTLMTRAAAAAADAARARFPEANRWQIVCGAGNNAGDGYVLGKIAAGDGMAVSVLALVDPSTLQGDAATAYQDFAAAGGVVQPWSGELDCGAGLIVDAMLGSGLTRDVQGDFAAAVTAVNAHDAPVLALDIPTGLDGDTGAVLGSAVKADVTVTFVGLKTGLYLDQGPGHCGDIVFADLDIDKNCRDVAACEFRRIESRGLGTLLPKRPRVAHKGDFGHVLVVGGGPGMPGAIRLCGEAALRAGAGRVSIATHSEHAAIIVASRPELMSYAIGSADDLKPLMQTADVVAFGPGLGRDAWAHDLCRALAIDKRPAVWDADALHWLAGNANCGDRADCANDRIITPHPGEAGVLLDTTSATVQGDRPEALAQLQERYGGVVVLKGAGSLVSGGDGVPWLCTAGNPGMAAPGMGDVLTGIIAALLSQGLDNEDAAVAGVALHAMAGDQAATSGERGLLASDLFAPLQRLVNP